jgi:hypothetical protein
MLAVTRTNPVCLQASENWWAQQDSNLRPPGS